MNLRWNTSEYGGVKDLRIPPHRLWKPGMCRSKLLKRTTFGSRNLCIEYNMIRVEMNCK